MFRSSDVLPRRIAALVGAAIVLPTLPACGAGPADADDGRDGDRIPVVLDYSPTVSDAGALLYLAAHPDVELLAVTLPSTGEADCAPGVRITRALLTVAGRGDVPIGCGAEVPVEGGHEWPSAWRDAANHLTGVVLPGVGDEQPIDAGQLLHDVLRATDEPATVVAVAPLTNLALLLNDEPDLGRRIARVVTMGGAVRVPGNVEASPAAEWNYFVDPVAVRDVIASGVETLIVPLDATNGAPWTAGLIARIGASAHPVARTEHQIVSSRPSLDGLYLWDELAAVAAVEPAVVTTESMTLSVADDGALDADHDGWQVDVATAIDVDAATTALLRIFNGGVPLVFDELTEHEAAYFERLAERMAALDADIESMGEPPTSSTVRELATLLVDTFWSVLADIRTELADSSPPDSLSAHHEAFASVVDQAIAMHAPLLHAIDDLDGGDPWTLFDAGLHQVDPDLPERLTQSCAELEEFSVVRGGPELCVLFGE